jgi:hypothetical protein
MMPTLYPRDRVKFAGHEWHVFLTVKDEHPDSPVVIWRGDGLDAITLTRLRRELELIPREATNPEEPR